MTTRVCHSKTVLRRRPSPLPPARPPHFERDIRGRVMIPGFARPAHRRLRHKLAEIAAWTETSPLNQVKDGDRKLGIFAAGIAYVHAREAAPGASFLKLGTVYPLPFEKIRAFARSVARFARRQNPEAAGRFAPPADDELFVNLVSQQLGLPVIERQALLEAEGLHERAERLGSVLEFHMQALRSGAVTTARPQ